MRSLLDARRRARCARPASSASRSCTAEPLDGYETWHDRGLAVERRARRRRPREVVTRAGRRLRLRRPAAACAPTRSRSSSRRRPSAGIAIAPRARTAARTRSRCDRRARHDPLRRAAAAPPSTQRSASTHVRARPARASPSTSTRPRIWRDAGAAAEARLQGVGGAVRAPPAPRLLGRGRAARARDRRRLRPLPAVPPSRAATGRRALPWLGALGERTERALLGTSVLTPTMRYHPSMIAQAFATLACLNPGRVFLGVGTGESLNETPADRRRVARREGAPRCGSPRRST